MDENTFQKKLAELVKEIGNLPDEDREKLEALEPFHPDRIASRILGMGDILSLIEEAQRKVDKKKAEKLARKMEKGRFDLEDFRDQLAQMSNLGGVSSMLEKLPGMSLDALQALTEAALVVESPVKDLVVPEV